MNKMDRIALEDIQVEILEIDDFLCGVDADSFLSDKKTNKAICMSIINICEIAKKRLSQDFRLANNHVPWKEIIDLRNDIAHEYNSMQLSDIWDFINQDFPVIQDQINELLKKST